LYKKKNVVIEALKKKGRQTLQSDSQRIVLPTPNSLGFTASKIGLQVFGVRDGANGNSSNNSEPEIP